MPKPLQKPYPKFYLGGGSGQAAELSAKHSDVHLFWGDTIEQIITNMKALRACAARHDRESDLGFGMRLQIVCRENERDAWEAANGLMRNVTAERTNYIQTHYARIGRQSARAGAGADKGRSSSRPTCGAV